MANTRAVPAWLPVEASASVKDLGIIKDSMEYTERLFHYAYASQVDDVHFMEYRLLQRVNIFHIQNELAKLEAAYWTNLNAGNDTLDELKVTLHDYVTAVRDHAYLRSMTSLNGSQAAERRRDLTQAFPGLATIPGDPFNSRYCTLAPSPGPLSDPLRSFLKTHLPRTLTYTAAEIRQHTDEFLARRPPETISPFVDKLARFLVAFIGGASLVVPMLVMSLPKTEKVKSLITVSVAVTIFAALMSLGIRAGNAETLVATATYAAVLVVFVGTSM